MRVFRSLANPSFTLLWSGQTISRLGDSFFTVALAWWVLEKTHSASAMGLVLVFSSVPMLLLLLLGGVFVDRIPRLRIMLSSDLLRAGIVGLIAALAVSGRLEVWHILIMSALFGTVDAFFFPAYTAILPDIVAVSDLPSATSLRSISRELAGIIGPALAGWIVARGGSWLTFGIDALTFVVSACCLLAIPRKPLLHISDSEFSSALNDLCQGLQTVLQSPWLWITIAIAGISNITMSGPFEAVLPLLVAQRFNATAETYGSLMTLSSVGALIAALLLGRSRRIRRRGLLVYGPWIVAGLMLVLMGASSSLAGLWLAASLWGASTSTLNLVWANSLQELVPHNLLGRVASVDALGSYALLPVGYACAGVAADHWSASMVFLLGGTLSGLVIASGLLHPAVRGLD